MAELNNTIVRGNLRVVSQMEAQEILENGTSLANKYLQLSGGELYNGTNDTPLVIKSATGAAFIQFKNSGGTTIGYLGVNSSNQPSFYDTSSHRLAYYSDLGSYLPLSGGNMTGNISYTGSNATNTMIRFINNTSDAYGNGIAIGGGGIVIIGAGESNGLSYGSAGDENLHLAADTNVYLYSNAQNGLDSAKIASLNSSGVFNAPTLSENGTSLVDKYLEITDIASWAKAANKPSYTFAGTAVTSGGNSGTAVAAVTGYSSFSGGSGSLTSNDTSSGGIAYISTGSTTSVVTGVAANGTSTVVTGYGSFSGGSGSLTGNTTASGGIPYVEASLSGTELTLTVKYLHHGHTAASLGTASTATVLTGVKASGTANAYTSLTTKYLHHGHTAASLGSPSTSNCAPSGHTHSVTAAGNIS